jgi:hypothetical protein
MPNVKVQNYIRKEGSSSSNPGIAFYHSHQDHLSSFHQAESVYTFYLLFCMGAKLGL